MERRLEQLARVAGMVVVRVRNDRLANVVELDARRLQRINRAPQKSPFTRARRRLTRCCGGVSSQTQWESLSWLKHEL